MTAISADFIAEKFGYANEMAQDNPRLKEKVDRFFGGTELVSFPHEASDAQRLFVAAPWTA